MIVFLNDSELKKTDLKAQGQSSSPHPLPTIPLENKILESLINDDVLNKLEKDFNNFFK
jgi:hypothetical protein